MLRFFLLADDDPNAAERLDDPRRAAARTGREALHRDRLADTRLGDDQRRYIEVEGVLRVGDRGREHLVDILGHPLGRELEDVQRFLDLAAADQARHEVELARRTPNGVADRQRFLVADLAGCSLLGHQRLPFLSDAWPWKVRVGANSPSFIPTMSSLTDTGTNLRPL